MPWICHCETAIYGWGETKQLGLSWASLKDGTNCTIAEYEAEEDSK